MNDKVCPVFPRVLETKMRQPRAHGNSGLWNNPESLSYKRAVHTSSPSSSTTGFLTLILVSEAIVRIWAKFRGIGPDQRGDAATRVVRENEVEIDREEVEKEEEEREEERGAERGVRERRANAELDRRAFIVSYSEVSANVPQVGHSMPAAYNRGNEVRQKGKCGVERIPPEKRRAVNSGFRGDGRGRNNRERRQIGRDNYRMTGEWRDWRKRRGKSLVRGNGELFDAPLLTAEKRRSRMSRDSDDRESFTSQWIYRFL
jgi:hypothetical protein